MKNEKLKKDPVEFTRTVLGATPFEGQERILRGIRPTTVIRAGRQWGKSTVLSWYVAWYLTTHANRIVMIVAPTVTQSKIIFKEVAKHFRTGPLAPLLAKNITEHPFPQIILKNGCECIGRGTNSPEYIRGQPVHLIITDETSFIKEDVIKYVLMPMLLVTGQQQDSGIIMTSTPMGRGEFYDQCMYAEKKQAEGDPEYAAFHFTALESPYSNKKKLDAILEEHGEESLLWQTEYLAEFADSDLSVFPWLDIKAAFSAYPHEHFPVAPREKRTYVQGVDLANRQDYFVAAVMDTTEPSMNVLVHLDRRQRAGYDVYKSMIRSNYRFYNYPHTLIDSTSLGDTVVQDLIDIHAEGYAIASNAAKWDLVQDLARMLSERRLAIPNEKVIIDELRYFSYEVTKSKTIKMQARKGHDDVVMALAFCARLANRPQYIGLFQGVNIKRPLEPVPVELHERKVIKPETKTEYKDPFKELWES